MYNTGHNSKGACLVITYLSLVFYKALKLRSSTCFQKLAELGVEMLVLPAATSVLDTWISSFGFSVMEESARQNLLDINILNFHGTVMCQKLLARTPSMELIVSASG